MNLTPTTSTSNTKCTYHIGIDPGWKNLGLAILKKEENDVISIVHTQVFNPSKSITISEFIKELDSVIVDKVTHVDSINIERYVAYQGVNTAETENITMVIGALCYYFSSQWDAEPDLYRAIDWKHALIKLLYKLKGFNNPSTSLDKKFSLAAASCVTGAETDLPTDHEADSVCLAVLPIYLEISSNIKKG